MGTKLTTTDVAAALDIGYGTAAAIIRDLDDDGRDRLGIARSKFGRAWEIPTRALPRLKALAAERMARRGRPAQTEGE